MKLAGNTANTVHKVTNMVEQAESTKQNMQLMNQAMRQTKNLIGNDPSKLALKAMMMSEKMEMFDETMNEMYETINVIICFLFKTIIEYLELVIFLIFVNYEKCVLFFLLPAVWFYL